MLASPKIKRFAHPALGLSWLAAGIGLALCLLLGNASAQAAPTSDHQQLPSPTPTMVPGAMLPSQPQVYPQPAANAAQPQPAPVDLRAGVLQAADTIAYNTGFAPYTAFWQPDDWTWYTRGSMLYAPSIIYYGGGGTDEYKRLEITDEPVGEAQSWLIKDGWFFGSAKQVDVTINFQTADAGTAGIVVGWRDLDNFAAVLLDQFNDTVWILVYQNGEATWQNNGIGATVIEPYLDYHLIAFAPDPSERGMAPLSAWIVPPGGDLTHLLTSTASVDTRGRIGLGAVDGFPRVIFDEFWSYGDPLSQPSATWISPEGNGVTWDVYGDTVQMAYTVTNDINVWQAQVVRYDAASGNWVTVADLRGPPYEFTLDTGSLDFGYNEFAIDLYTIDLQKLREATIWLYRQRVPEILMTSYPTAFTLVANGYSESLISVEVRDRGSNPLPDILVAFTGESVSIEPENIITDGNGQATVTVRAGTAAGSGKVFVTVTPGELGAEIPVTLVAGPASSLAVSAGAGQLLADGASSAAVVATLTDAFGNPITGVNVSFAATLGTVNESAVTNHEGKATVQFVAGSALGEAQIAASYGDLAAAASVHLIAGPLAQFRITAAPAFLYADGASFGAVRVQALDAYSHPLPNLPVQFSTSLGEIEASATTNTEGMAAARLTAGTVTGSAEVAAWLGGFSSAATVEMVAGPAAVLQLNPTLRQVILADGDQTTISILVRDAYAHPLPGATVYLSTTLGSITPVVVTDANGVATAVLSSLRNTGRALVTAAVGDVMQSVEVVFKAFPATLYLALVQRNAQIEEWPPLLLNGYFDEGESWWSQSINGEYGRLIYRYGEKPAIPAPASPPYVAWLGGADSQVNRLSQGAALPHSYAVSLEFLYYTESGEKTCGQDTAVLEVVAGGSSWTLQEFDLCYPRQGKTWRTGMADLSRWRGQSINLQFRSVLNNDKISNLFVDNVRFCSSDPAAQAKMPACAAQ